jgi:hypothetical protein
MNIHPKTSGAAVGFALGTVIVSVLASFHSIHLTPEAAGAIPGGLATLGAWLVPGPDTPPVSAELAEALAQNRQVPAAAPVPAAVIPVRPVNPPTPPAA